MSFEISELRNSTVWGLYRLRERIQVDPDYQRLSGIWTIAEHQLLIDTVLNDLDVPKLYLHKFTEPLRNRQKVYDYAIIDGKQRLETFWSFINGDFAIANDFIYFADSKVNVRGMTYAELGRSYPDLKTHFDSFHLTTILVETDEIEMIEEMFSRLNEAAPLSAPEKRNAYGGQLPGAIRKLAKASFFTSRLPFSNKRYRHLDLATKFLLAEHDGKVRDTKKAHLDNFVGKFADQPKNKAPGFARAATTNVDRMAAVFTQKDTLLRQVGMVTLYYHLFRVAYKNEWGSHVTRQRLADFDKRRAKNRELAEHNVRNADFDLLQFDRYAQSPNDAAAIRFRLAVLCREAFSNPIEEDKL